MTKEKYNTLENAFRALLKEHIDHLVETVHPDGFVRFKEIEKEWLDRAGLPSKKLKHGGDTKEISKETQEDVAWDIGLEKGWIKSGNWIDDESKSKAFALAELELLKYGHEIDWIITGKHIK